MPPRHAQRGTRGRWSLTSDFCAVEKLLHARTRSIPSYPTYQFLHPQQIISPRQLLLAFTVDRWASYTNIISHFERTSLSSSYQNLISVPSYLALPYSPGSLTSHMLARLITPVGWSDSDSDFERRPINTKRLSLSFPSDLKRFKRLKQKISRGLRSQILP